MTTCSFQQQPVNFNLKCLKINHHKGKQVVACIRCKTENEKLIN